MDTLPEKDQIVLRELLQKYDRLILEIEEEGLNPDNAKLLYDVYDAMSKLLGDAWSKMPEVNSTALGREQGKKG